jgi:acyl-CoA synthetase (AMP-forming)/AMP-acid ligase II
MRDLADMSPPSLLDAWQMTLRAAPSAVALVDAATARTWTRAEIDAAADAWVTGQTESFGRRIVALAEPNGAEWMRVFLGLLKNDAVIAPLGTTQSEITSPRRA